VTWRPGAGPFSAEKRWRRQPGERRWQPL